MDDEAKRRPSPSRRTPSLGNCMVMIKDRDCNNGTADDDDNDDEDGDYKRFTSQCAEYGGGGGGSGGCSHNGPPVKIMLSIKFLARTITMMIPGDDDVS